MDFVEWALALYPPHDDLSRQLKTRSHNPDDDFVNLEVVDLQQPSVYDTSAATTYTPPAVANALDRPLISQSAEAELYLLATNFLLYVALVIITALVAKIYFPEWLERGRNRLPRSYSFVRRTTPSQEDRWASSSGYLDEEEQEKSSSSNTEDNVLDSGDEDDLDRLYFQEQQGDGVLVETDDKSFDDMSDVQELLGRRPQQGQHRRSSFLEFDQERMSRKQVVSRLLFCSLMLNITFVTWGALQERMLTRRYPRHTGDYFTYSYALVFTNRFWTLIMSGILMLYLKPRQSQTTVIYEYSFPSISNMLSSWCQYEALRYVSFPATTLFKSFKLAPVMFMGFILGNKTYPLYDYMVALVIGVGVTMFMSSTDELHVKSMANGEISAGWTGVMLLVFFLFFDAFTSQFQSRMFSRHADLSMVELMFATSAYSTVLSLVTLLHSHELTPALEFVYNHSEIHLHFFFFSICSTIGQLLIFYTIKNFGAVVFTLIMTTRILLSIALSCYMYGHSITGIGFVGLMMVVSAVLYRIKRKAEGRQLVKWQGMEDDKAQELVQEWHEHLDM